MRKSGGKYIAAIVLLFAAPLSVIAQVNVRATVNRDKILIGEPINVTVEAYMPLGLEFSWIRADSIPAFEITNVSKPDTTENIDGKKLSQVLVITSFDSGQQYIPPFEIVVNREPFYTDSIPIEVTFTPFDRSADYRDIKDIIEITNPATKYIPYYIAALAILSLVALVILLRKRKSAVLTPEKIIPNVTPYEEAMKSLQQLSLRHNNIQDIKNYYSDLNDVLRKYLAREYSIATFERTNEELIMQLSRLELSRDAYLGLAQSLRMSDFVKFAKYVPGEKENIANLETVRSSIELLNNKSARAV